MGNAFDAIAKSTKAGAASCQRKRKIKARERGIEASIRNGSKRGANGIGDGKRSRKNRGGSIGGNGEKRKSAYNLDRSGIRTNVRSQSELSEWDRYRRDQTHDAWRAHVSNRSSIPGETMRIFRDYVLGVRSYLPRYDGRTDGRSAFDKSGVQRGESVKDQLEPGILASTGRPWRISPEIVTETIAIIGIRGSGKTATATVFAEEMLECGLAPIALDPVGVWWGLRCKPDGSPGGYPIVIVGGQRGDIPLDPKQARKVCDAIIDGNVPAVIDLSQNSKNEFRHFVTEFCDRLMEVEPSTPRHIFIEEAPELVPQRPMGEQKRSRAAVDRLFRLGRNKGYGGSLISQRYATIDKDVLTQCQNIMALRSMGKTDRDAAEGWVAEVVEDQDKAAKAKKFMRSLTTLGPGEGWFLSPLFLDAFDHVQIRPRKTFHPGATRKVGDKPKAVALSDVSESVARMREILKKPDSPKKSIHDLGKPLRSTAAIVREMTRGDRSGGDELQAFGLHAAETSRLRSELQRVNAELAAARKSVQAVRDLLKPDFDKLTIIFGVQQGVASTNGGGDISMYEPFRKKLGPKPMEMIEALINHGGELTRARLGTLIGLPHKGSTYSTYIKRLRAVEFIETPDKTIVRIRPI